MSDDQRMMALSEDGRDKATLRQSEGDRPGLAWGRGAAGPKMGDDGVSPPTRSGGSALL